MLSTVVFKVSRVQISNLRTLYIVKHGQIVFLSKDKLFELHVGMKAVSPNRRDERQTKCGTENTAQDPKTSHSSPFETKVSLLGGQIRGKTLNRFNG